MAEKFDYKKAGVDVNEGYKAVDKYKKQSERARIPGQLKIGRASCRERV